MQQKERSYIAIDLKSFYASVECVERGRDPLTTHLVVADVSRTEKTICLAVSPSLKAYGISGRARLFEVVQRTEEINRERKCRAGGVVRGASDDALRLREDDTLALDYIAATPRMQLYIDYSTRIYEIYLQYVAPADIHVYSIDEVFMDVTDYLRTCGMSARELTKRILHHVLQDTGITATAGIGTNLYLAKIAMDIGAKKAQPDEDGVRIAQFDEKSYRRALWSHTPVTDFWRVGRGYAKKLAAHGLFTMGDIAVCSLGGPKDFYNAELLYRLFGVNAELLIDHAWGYEPVTIAEVKAYRPKANSLSAGQVLQRPYAYAEARLIVKEMCDQLVLDLVARRLLTDRITLTIGYDSSNLQDTAHTYKGEIRTGYYGRDVPAHAHGSTPPFPLTSSSHLIMEAVMALYQRIADRTLTVRRVTITAEHVIREEEVKFREGISYEQMSLFGDSGTGGAMQDLSVAEKEKHAQQAVLSVRERFGKNALVKGMNLLEGATGMARNEQIGGHRA